MRWRQRARLRQEELLYQQEARLRQFLWEVLLPQLLAEQRALQWEMALPLADSLTRLDKRQLASQMQQVEHQQELREMLMEVLQGQVPPISQQLGLLSLPPSSPHSVS
jgi:hypothetical protein